ncbi:hypothetical protein Tco_0569316 [Tanacetum coccineum]
MDSKQNSNHGIEKVKEKITSPLKTYDLPPTTLLKRISSAELNLKGDTWDHSLGPILGYFYWVDSFLVRVLCDRNIRDLFFKYYGSADINCLFILLAVFNDDRRVSLCVPSGSIDEGLWVNEDGLQPRKAVRDLNISNLDSAREELLHSVTTPFKAEYLDDSIPSKGPPSDPIVQSVDINTKSTTYAGAAGESTKELPRVISNFCPLLVDPVYDDVNISIPRKVVENASTHFEHTLYGYFIGKRMAFPAGLEAVLEGGPWMIRNSPIILKNEDDISLIPTFIGKPIMLDSYTSSMCNDSWGRSSFARVVSPLIVTTSNVVTPTVEKTNDGIQTVGKKKKRKGKSKSTNGGQFFGPLVKLNVRYEPKAITSAPTKGATNVGNASKSSTMSKTTCTSSKNDNIIMSNSYSDLNKE